MKKNVLYHVDFHYEKEGKEYNWYGFIIRGESHYIVSSRDLIHELRENDRPIVVDTVESENVKEGVMSVNPFRVPAQFDFEKIELFCKIRVADPVQDISYFGIKSRVRDNYNLFRGSLKEIGCKVDLPEWERKCV